MARPDFREVLAWALFAAVTAVYVHSTSQLELCKAQLEISRADMRASTSFSTGGDTGPWDRGNAGLSNEPSEAVPYVDALFNEPSEAIPFVDALPDIHDSANVDTASGATRCKPIAFAQQARMQPNSALASFST
jgi:hypothetical protein